MILFRINLVQERGDKVINVIKNNTDIPVNLTELISFNNNCIKNRIWYRGDPSELEEFFLSY